MVEAPSLQHFEAPWTHCNSIFRANHLIFSGGSKSIAGGSKSMPYFRQLLMESSSSTGCQTHFRRSGSEPNTNFTEKLALRARKEKSWMPERLRRKSENTRTHTRTHAQTHLPLTCLPEIVSVMNCGQQYLLLAGASRSAPMCLKHQFGN